MKQICAIILFVSALALAGCSGDEELGKASDDHVWKEQVDAIDNARSVESTLEAAAALQKDRVESE